MLKSGTGLSIPMSILRLHFITQLIFIHLPIQTYDIPGKTHNPTNHITDNNQGFIQALLISVIRHKKLNLTIEFGNSIFI